MTTSLHYAQLDPQPPAGWRERLRPYALALVAMIACAALTVAFYSLANSVQATRTAAAVSKAQADQATQIANVARQQADATQRQLDFTRNLLCGGFVPISNAPISETSTALGNTIRGWASSGAALLDCPKG